MVLGKLLCTIFSTYIPFVASNFVIILVFFEGGGWYLGKNVGLSKKIS